MQAASYVSTDGTDKVIDYSDGKFSVDGQFVAREQVLAWDAQGSLSWSSPLTSEWAAGLPSGEAVAPSEKASLFSRLPGWAKVLFVFLWPVSIPYAVVRMWKGARWPVPVRLIVSLVAAGALLFLSLFSAAFGLVAGGDVPAAQVARPETSTRQVPSAVATRTPAAVPAPALAPETAIVALPATVVRVIDGDTAVFQLEGGAEEKVRFIGVDTPELSGEGSVYGAEASAYTAAALPVGTQVFLEQDVQERDVYGRLLAYVWLTEPTALTESELRDRLFNAKLALDGYAQQMTIQPDSKYAEYFTTFVAEARASEVGLWSPAVVAAAKAAAEPAPAPKPAPKPKPTPKPKPKPKKSSGVTVYITDTGAKYHTAGCQYLRQSKHAISLKAAKAQGYTPCSRCNPPS